LERVGAAKFPCVGVTDLGEEVLAGRQSVSLDFHAGGTGTSAAKKRSRAPAGSGTAGPVIGGGAHDDLYERLRQLRNDLASDKGVPVFRILPNAALQELAEQRPVTQEEALQIKGIGPSKARTVVPDFLAEIATWRQENG